MAPFSRAAGRWCPLLKLQAEFPKEAFHEPERPQLPAPCRSSAGEDAGSGPSSAARAGSQQNCHHVLGWQEGREQCASLFPASCPGC